MTEAILKHRFLQYALSIHQLTKQFPKESVYFIITNQITRSSSSSGANYHAACRGKSSPDFVNKLKITEEELDETLYWLDYLVGVNAKWESITIPHRKEGNELLSIIVASINTFLSRHSKSRLQ